MQAPPIYHLCPRYNHIKDRNTKQQPVRIISAPKQKKKKKKMQKKKKIENKQNRVASVPWKAVH